MNMVVMNMMLMNTLGDEYGGNEHDADEYDGWWIWWRWTRLVMNMALMNTLGDEYDGDEYAWWWIWQCKDLRHGLVGVTLVWSSLTCSRDFLRRGQYHTECICLNCKVYLFGLQDLFVWIAKGICLNCYMYLSECEFGLILAFLLSWLPSWRTISFHYIALHCIHLFENLFVTLILSYIINVVIPTSMLFSILRPTLTFNFWSCILFVVHLSSLRAVHYLATPVYTPVYPSILFGYLSVLFGYPSLLFGYPSIPQYTLVYPSVPHYTQVYPSIPQYTPIYTSSPQYTPVYPHLIFVTTITTQPL